MNSNSWTEHIPLNLGLFHRFWAFLGLGVHTWDWRKFEYHHQWICIAIHNYHGGQDKRLNINIAQYFPSTWPYNLSRTINNACSSCLLPCGQYITSNMTLIYRYGNMEVIWPWKSGPIIMDIYDVKGFIITRLFKLQALSNEKSVSRYCYLAFPLPLKYVCFLFHLWFGIPREYLESTS